MFSNKNKTEISVNDTVALQEKFLEVARACNEQLDAFYQSIVFDDKMLANIVQKGYFSARFGKRPATNLVLEQMPATHGVKEKMKNLGVCVNRVYHDGYDDIYFEATFSPELLGSISPVAMLEHKKQEETAAVAPNINVPKAAPIQ